MNERFLKPYNPTETEARIYSLWEEGGFFNPNKAIESGFTREDAPTYTVIMPPPNVTGVLHMGHALMLTVEDIFVRYNRMLGKRTLWLPGTDHAAIATQSKVEKEIQKEEKKSRHDIGREELLKRIDSFAKQSHDTIVSQIKVMGASCDWGREAFTLDEKRNLAVKTVFKKMYEDGLIYRGERMVNWDTKGQTTIADDEVVYVEEKTKFYYLKYGPFTIGTARPETKFGDKYVVMHPEDSRFKEYTHGQKLMVEWINGPIEATVIKDERIDMEFGTGVMTITPAHSQIDFDIAETHKLDREKIIDQYGKLLPIAGEFAMMKIKDAREKIIEKLDAKGLLVKTEDYTHNIATAERTGGIIEPQIMTQWFVAVNKPFILPHSEINGIKSGTETTLKEIMQKAVSQGQIKIIPDYFDKTYFHWIDNLRDWCISRQIWYGHRIPVWYRDGETHVDTNPPSETWEKDGWTQDPDTLDTWFSSALWTFSTLGWPDKTKDLLDYHPTNLLETGYEILFFWVARMVLMSGYVLGQIPFSTVYLHGTVRDAKGQKMSKSLGNGIDPIDVAKEFGTDAGRMALISGTAAGTDSSISKDKIRGYKNFANKLWNITRFVLSNQPSSFETPEVQDEDIQEMYKEFSTATNELDNFRIHNASERIYHYVWHTFADKIIEESKGDIANEETKRKLYFILSTSLKMLHPFMPFVTEEIWQNMPHPKDRPLLMVESWPKFEN
ncbi:MAG: valine--tRNA ligase [Parcubacteria bacterium C7867-005]|nr:MAG: valine--tRNA ligase [Parcubacteria bacterium C7867-005]